MPQGEQLKTYMTRSVASLLRQFRTCFIDRLMLYFPSVNNKYIVNILKIWTTKKFAVITLKFEQDGFTVV